MTKQKLHLGELSTPLSGDYLDFMPKTVTMYGDTCYAIILAYKDSRVDMQVLDNIIGPGNWQNEYKRDSKGVLQCGIGIWIEERGEWVWKWSNGVPSKIESDKGEYSDAMKRAGYMWGIGRALYDFPPVRIVLNDQEYRMKPDGGVQATGYLKPNNWNWEIWIDYEKGCYEHIVVSDKKGNVRFNMNPHKKQFQDPKNRQLPS